MGVTFVEGANSTPADGTIASTTTSSSGEVTNIILGYINGSTFTPLADADGLLIQGDTVITDLTAATFNTPVSVGDATSSTTLIAANADRKGWTIQNMSTADLYVRIDGGTAAIGSCHRVLRQYESMGQRIMDGDLSLEAITGRWASDAGGTAVGGDWE